MGKGNTLLNGVHDFVVVIHVELFVFNTLGPGTVLLIVGLSYH